MTNNTPQWFDPLYNLIEDRLKLLDRTPATKQGTSRELQSDNHQAMLGKYILMAQEFLTEEERERLFQITCLTPLSEKNTSSIIIGSCAGVLIGSCHS